MQWVSVLIEPVKKRGVFLSFDAGAEIRVATRNVLEFMGGAEGTRKVAIRTAKGARFSYRNERSAGFVENLSFDRYNGSFITLI
jgi:hypothetical protein